jgi:hypothetical protein
MHTLRIHPTINARRLQRTEKTITLFVLLQILICKLEKKKSQGFEPRKKKGKTTALKKKTFEVH